MPLSISVKKNSCAVLSSVVGALKSDFLSTVRIVGGGSGICEGPALLYFEIENLRMIGKELATISQKMCIFKHSQCS